MLTTAIATKEVACLDYRFRVSGIESDEFFARIDHYIQEDAYLAKVIERVTGAAPTIVDVGANIGATVALTAAIRPKGTIVAVEPSPLAFECLRKTAAANPGPTYHLFNEGAAAEAGDVWFTEQDNLSNSHISKDRSGLSIPVRRIDDIASEFPRIDFIKIDVEGFELDVIEGLSNIERRDSPVIFLEFNSWALLGLRDISPRDVLRRLAGQFQFVFQIDRTTAGLVRMDTEQQQVSFLYHNLLHHGCVDDLVVTNDVERAQHFL